VTASGVSPEGVVRRTVVAEADTSSSPANAAPSISNCASSGHCPCSERVTDVPPLVGPRGGETLCRKQAAAALPSSDASRASDNGLNKPPRICLTEKLPLKMRFGGARIQSWAVTSGWCVSSRLVLNLTKASQPYLSLSKNKFCKPLCLETQYSQGLRPNAAPQMRNDSIQCEVTK